jgi:hypothetical protein
MALLSIASLLPNLGAAFNIWPTTVLRLSEGLSRHFFVRMYRIILNRHILRHSDLVIFAFHFPE